MPRRGGPPKKSKIPGVKHVVVVASGKGGVGKSTVAGECTRLAILEGELEASCACNLPQQISPLLFLDLNLDHLHDLSQLVCSISIYLDRLFRN